MKSLVSYIAEFITEAVAKNPLLKHEIKNNGSFEAGDVVLFREFYEAGDDSIIMIVAEDRGNRSLVSEIGTSLALGSTKTLSNRDMFKVGQVKIDLSNKNHPIIPAESVAQAIRMCEELGMNCDLIKEREQKRSKIKF